MDYLLLIGHICIKDEDHQINESKKTYKPFELIKLYSFYGINIIFYPSINVNNSFKGFHKL